MKEYNGSDKHKIALFEPMTGATAQSNGEKGLVPMPLIADREKFLRGDGTWAEAGGGGTGDVQDVYVNGTSVLDEDNIAQITSYKELTQAQYDALPQSKLTDGVLYCIKDSGVVEGDQFAPVIYSLVEREIGTWIDSKPLYQKTVTGFSKTVTYGDWTNITYNELGVSDIDRLIDCRAYDSNNLEFALGEFCAYPSYQLIQVQPSLETRVLDTITIVYTKTTDIPGSGSWGTDGVPMVHYSTNEKVIGTWIDGSTIYEKVIDFGQNVAIAYDDWTDITTVVTTSWANIIMSDGLDENGTYSPLSASGSEGYLELRSTLNIFRYVRYLIIRYTKTT